MAIFGSYVQMVIRGLSSGQQWQISPCWTVTDVDTASPITGDFQFINTSLSAWFIAMWNGWGVIPTNGISDVLASIMPEETSVTEVRLYAKTNTMALPEQALITGALEGTRGDPGTQLPSYVAVSAYARSLQYGRKGASMRLPILIDTDVAGNFIIEGTRDTIRNGILSTFTSIATQAAIETGLGVLSGGGEIVNVFELRPCSVQRVVQPGKTKPSFPYEGFGNISAVECGAWDLNQWSSTQNSRKIGRGR